MRRIFFGILLLLLTPTFASGYSFVFGDVEMSGDASLSLRTNNAIGTVSEITASIEFIDSTQLGMTSTTPNGYINYAPTQSVDFNTSSFAIYMSHTLWGNAGFHPELYLEYTAESQTTMSFPFEVVSDYGVPTGSAQIYKANDNWFPHFVPIEYQITDGFGSVLDLDLLNHLELNTTYQLTATLELENSGQIEFHNPDWGLGSRVYLGLMPESAPVPEPATVLLLGFGGGVGAWVRRLSQRKRTR